jgi:hypothetical protein
VVAVVTLVVVVVDTVLVVEHLPHSAGHCACVNGPNSG